VKPEAQPWTGRAPGRVNLIGEHVDYLGGRVLPCAVDRFTTARGHPAAAWEVESAVSGGLRYVRAIGERLGAGPQHVALESTVPPGAGLSSSAALLVSVAAGLRPELDGAEAALLCQAAEQSATGVMVGVMDQFASALGRAGHALLLDCGSLEYRHVPFPASLVIAVIDSGVERNLPDTPYNLRRREAEAGMPKRMRHVESELARVDAFVAALERGEPDLAALGRLLLESHASLRDDFEVSTPAVDALVERACAHPGSLGARVMGAGFGGSVLALLEAGRERGFEAAVGRPVIFCKTADGAFAR
jgi:galactokinase